MTYTLELTRDGADADLIPVSVMVDTGAGRYPLDPAPSQKIRNHSPDGFEWGYMGSGPSQLALAILLHHTQNAAIAQAHYMDFKSDLIASMPKRGGHITSHQVEAFLNLKKTK